MDQPIASNFERRQIRMKIFYRGMRYKSWIWCTACAQWMDRRAKGRHAKAHERAGWPMLDVAVWMLPIGDQNIVIEAVQEK